MAPRRARQLRRSGLSLKTVNRGPASPWTAAFGAAARLHSTHHARRCAKSAWKAERQRLTVVRGSKASARAGRDTSRRAGAGTGRPSRAWLDRRVVAARARKKNQDGVSPSFRQPCGFGAVQVFSGYNAPNGPREHTLASTHARLVSDSSPVRYMPRYVPCRLSWPGGPGRARRTCRELLPHPVGDSVLVADINHAGLLGEVPETGRAAILFHPPQGLGEVRLATQMTTFKRRSGVPASIRSSRNREASVSCPSPMCFRPRCGLPDLTAAAASWPPARAGMLLEIRQHFFVTADDLADQVRPGDGLLQLAGRAGDAGDQRFDLELVGVHHQAHQRLLIVRVAADVSQHASRGRSAADNDGTTDRGSMVRPMRSKEIKRDLFIVPKPKSWQNDRGRIMTRRRSETCDLRSVGLLGTSESPMSTGPRVHVTPEFSCHRFSCPSKIAKNEHRTPAASLPQALAGGVHHDTSGWTVGVLVIVSFVDAGVEQMPQAIASHQGVGRVDAVAVRRSRLAARDPRTALVSLPSDSICGETGFQVHRLSLDAVVAQHAHATHDVWVTDR